MTNSYSPLPFGHDAACARVLASCGSNLSAALVEAGATADAAAPATERIVRLAVSFVWERMDATANGLSDASANDPIQAPMLARRRKRASASRLVKAIVDLNAAFGDVDPDILQDLQLALCRARHTDGDIQLSGLRSNARLLAPQVEAALEATKRRPGTAGFEEARTFLAHAISVWRQATGRLPGYTKSPDPVAKADRCPMLEALLPVCVAAMPTGTDGQPAWRPENELTIEVFRTALEHARTQWRPSAQGEN